MNFKSPFTYLIPCLFVLLILSNLLIFKNQHYVLLAKSFKEGSLAFTNLESISNTSPFNNEYYWPLGPLPTLLILPFLYISGVFYQSFISVPLSFLNFYLLYKLARHLGVEHKKSLLFSTFFIFGSIYTPLAALPASWYFSQVVACTFLILAIFEFTKRKGYLLTGLYIALAVATRLTILFSLPFFIYLIFKDKASIGKFTKLLLPVFISIILLGFYNQARFNNPFEHGYNFQLIPPDAQARRAQGLFSLKHVPVNIYYLLLKGPGPVLKDASHILKPPYITFDSFGLSIFFLSPILFLAYKANFKEKRNRASLLAIGATLIPLLTYYGIGRNQIGFRYALDFYPFTFLLLANASKKINYKLMIILVFWGVFFALFFTFSYLFIWENPIYKIIITPNV